MKPTKRQINKSFKRMTTVMIVMFTGILLLSMVSSTSNTPRKICLLGDSTMAGLQVQSTLAECRPEMTVASKAKVSSKVEQIPIVTGYDTIFILSGINNIYSGEKAESVMTKLVTLNNKLTILNKHVIFIVPLPCSGYSKWTPQIQSELNSLKKLMLERKEFTAKYLGEYMSDDYDCLSLKIDYDAGDGLHLSGDGQFRLGSILALMAVTH